MNLLESQRNGLTVIDDGSCVIVTIPVKKNSGLMYTLIPLLCVWLAGGIYLAIPFLSNTNPPSISFFIGVTLWALVFICGILWLLWTSRGRHIIKVDRNEISITYDFFGLDIANSYKVNEINRVQMEVCREWLKDVGKQKGFGRGILWFEHLNKIVRFGGGLNENQAGEITRKIYDRTSLEVYVDSAPESAAPSIQKRKRELGDQEYIVHEGSVVDYSLDSATDVAKENIRKRIIFALVVLAIGIVILFAGKLFLEKSDILLRIETWELWTALGVGAFLIIALTIKLGSQMDKAYQAKMEHVARQLGFQYNDFGKPEDAFGWEMTGTKDHRSVKIYLTRVNTGKYRESLVVIEISAKLPPDLSIDFLFGPISFKRPYRLKSLERDPLSHLQDKGIYAFVKGDFNPEVISRMNIGKILSMKEIRDAAISIKPDAVKLMYDFRLPNLNWNISFIKRAINETALLVDYIEKK